MLTVNTFNIYTVQYVGSTRRKLTFKRGLTLIGVTFIEGELYKGLKHSLYIK